MIYQYRCLINWKWNSDMISLWGLKIDRRWNSGTAFNEDSKITPLAIKTRSGIFYYICLYFPLDYTKLQAKSLQKGSKADWYMVQNLTWSGVYLIIIFSNAIIQKVLTFVPLTTTGTEVYVATMTIFLSIYYDALEETLTHM